MLDTIKKYLLYAGTERDKYYAAAPRIERSNRIFTMAFSAVGALLILVMFISSFFDNKLASVRYIYITGVVFCAMLFVMGLFSKNKPGLSYICMYTAGCGFLLYGIAVGTIDRPEMQTVTFMVMLIMFPLIFVDKPYRVFIFLTVFIILFLIAATLTKTGTVLFTDTIDAVIFGILAMAGGLVSISSKVKGYVLEDELKSLSEKDQLTGLYNRNAYEWQLKNHSKNCARSLACVYIDVNGLHTLNYTDGHKAGDIMLQCVANEITEVFGSEYSYRTGGDEYVAFIPDTELSSVLESLTALKANIEAKGYHIATGYSYAQKHDLDIHTLIRDAEKMMYQDKDAFYREKGSGR